MKCRERALSRGCLVRSAVFSVVLLACKGGDSSRLATRTEIAGSTGGKATRQGAHAMNSSIFSAATNGALSAGAAASLCVARVPTTAPPATALVTTVQGACGGNRAKRMVKRDPVVRTKSGGDDEKRLNDAALIRLHHGCLRQCALDSEQGSQNGPGQHQAHPARASRREQRARELRRARGQGARERAAARRYPPPMLGDSAIEVDFSAITAVMLAVTANLGM